MGDHCQDSSDRGVYCPASGGVSSLPPGPLTMENAGYYSYREMMDVAGDTQGGGFLGEPVQARKINDICMMGF